MLVGLRTEPYAAYLGALGVSRVVSEQLDPLARGYWQQGHFVLESAVDEDALVDFFVHHYAPTPIASPWNVGSGFIVTPKGSSPHLALQASTEPRFEAYRQALGVITTILNTETYDLGDPESKKQLILRLRNSLHGVARLWLDAVVSLERGDLDFNSLFFTGGNDGRLDFGLTFKECLRVLFLAPERGRAPAHSLLRSLLFEHDQGRHVRQSHGAFDPRTAANIVGSSRGEERPLSNPWSFVLAMEGLLCVDRSAMIGHVPSLGGSAAAKEPRREIRVPLWISPMLISQLATAWQKDNPLVDTYQGFAVVPRNGRAHFIFPSGTRKRATGYSLWGESRQWLNTTSLRGTETLKALMASEETQPVLTHSLEELGRLRLCDTAVPPLSYKWLEKADDGTAEYGLARSLSRLGSDLHEQLQSRPQMKHFEGRDLCEKMLRLMRFRVFQAQVVPRSPNHAESDMSNDPFWSSHTVSASHLRAFLRKEIDEARFENLLHGLCLVKSRAGAHDEGGGATAFLPYAFRVAKLAFSQHGGDRRPAPFTVSERLAQGHLQEAVSLAGDFLSPRHPHLRVAAQANLCQTAVEPRRLAAALLFPLAYENLLETLGERV